MPGESDLKKILKTLKPELHQGAYVFCRITELDQAGISHIVGLFKEAEGITVILSREMADQLKLYYSYVSAWITLTVHSSLESVGLTAAFSNALAAQGISCNVIAAYYHDHIFVDFKEAEKAMDVLRALSK